MKIHVCSLEKVHDVVEQIRPDRVVSLLGPGTPFPVITGLAQMDHHKVELDDIRKPMAGYVTPGEQHVAELIEFLQEWNPETPLVAHCWAGISRSTATAFIAACIHNPDQREEIIAQEIAQASPTAFPNTLIVSIADSILGRDGRMAKAAEEICQQPERLTLIRSIDEALPYSIPARF